MLPRMGQMLKPVQITCMFGRDSGRTLASREQIREFVVRLILAVDDERSGLYFRKLMLEHAGYKVLSAMGIDDALRVFASNPIDLVVTDHLLGRQVGTDMAREKLGDAKSFLAALYRILSGLVRGG